MVDVQGSKKASGSLQDLLRPRPRIGTVSIHQILLNKSSTSPAQIQGEGELTPLLDRRNCKDSLQRGREGNNYGHFVIYLKHHLLILDVIDYPLVIFYSISKLVTLFLIIHQSLSLTTDCYCKCASYICWFRLNFLSHDWLVLVNFDLPQICDTVSFYLIPARAKLYTFLSDPLEYIMVQSERC